MRPDRRLYGEVQKEVIQATLASDYGLEVAFRETTTLCVERPVGTGAPAEIIGTDPNPFLATVRLRVEPAPAGAFDKSMSSTARDFRQLTPLVLMDALAQAGTRVSEPVHRFLLEAPADTVGAFSPVLARLGAVPRSTVLRGPACLLEGEVPAARVNDLERRLPALTRGEGVLESAFDHYRPVRGPVPTRPRTDLDPLDRKQYLLRVLRRVPGPQEDG